MDRTVSCSYCGQECDVIEAVTPGKRMAVCGRCGQVMDICNVCAQPARKWADSGRLCESCGRQYVLGHLNVRLTEQQLSEINRWASRIFKL